MTNPFDEPTTINRDDIESEPPTIPHRHKDSDLREPFGIFVWPIIAAAVVGLLVLGYYWWIR